MSVTRARLLEKWLRALLAAYQDRSVKPRHLTYSNLTHLRRPTQMYGVTMKHGGGDVAALIVAHRKQVRNGLCRVVRVGSITELANFAATADKYFGTTDLVRTRSPVALLMPETAAGAQAALQLSSSVRGQTPPQPAQAGEFRVGPMQPLQFECQPALWVVRYRAPLPDPRAVLLQNGKVRRRPVAGKKVPSQTPQAVSQPLEVAYAAYSEPSLWFGEPPFPAIRERVLGGLHMLPRLERLIANRIVGDVQTYVYTSGRVLADTPDVDKARATINQVFGVLTRSGVLSLAVPRYELIDINAFERGDGSIRGSHAALTPRNSALGMPPGQGIGHLFKSLPEAIVPELLELADACAKDRGSARQSLRLLNAVSLLHLGIHTESFVTAWTLIERVMKREFEAFWIAHGRSRSTIRELDWTASQQIDLLLAVGTLGRDLGKNIHSLRKRRNDIVHKLADATENEASRCVSVAASLTPLPAFETIPSPKSFYLS